MDVQPISFSTLKNIIDQTPHEALLQSMEEAFVSYSSGNAIVPPVGTLTFDEPPADVHIKYGYIKDDDYYVIKIASGFYHNPALGLSSSNGLNLVFSQKTGELKSILLDEGYLTDVRTALAGAVVAKYLAPSQIDIIGIVGTGIQARLQLRYLQSLTPCRRVLNWGRDPARQEAYKSEMGRLGFSVSSTDDAQEISRNCQLIVTATAATEGILRDGDLQAGTLITAIGADTEGKQELHLDVLERADLIVLDSASQCQAHGEIHKAHSLGLLEDKPMVELGDILRDSSFHRNPDDIIVADLTGIATQDIQISKWALGRLSKAPSI